MYYLRRKNPFLAEYGGSSLVFLTLLGVLHVIVPFDLESALILRSNYILPALQAVLGFRILGLRVGSLILFVWAGGAIYYAYGELKIYLPEFRRRASSLYFEDEQLQQMAVSLGCKYRVKVSSDISVPHVAGVLRPVIYFPCIDFSDDELRYIFMHEMQHIRAHHGLKKFVFLAIKVLFWWNPAAHVPPDEINVMLETECDTAVLSRLDARGKEAYLKSIISAAHKLSPNTQTTAPNMPLNEPCMLTFAQPANIPKLKRRFDVMLRYDQRRTKRTCSLLNVAFFAAFILSYFIIIQPYYPLPKNDVQTQIELTDSSSFILHKDDQYHVYYNGDYFMSLTEDDLEYAPFNQLEIMEDLVE